MLLHVKHRTELIYSERISESVMELRMTPRSDKHQTLRGFCLGVGPAAPLFEHQDWLGNRVHQFSVVAFHEQVVILAESCVETHPQELALEAAPDALPLAMDDHRLMDFLRFQGPVEPDAGLEELARALELRAADRAGQVLLRLTHGLRKSLAYKKGVTTSSTPISEVLERRAGVCQDFAHVAIGLSRLLGIPARYVSGYLFRKRGDAELETHAWVEAYLPSSGWVPLDPTHAELPGEQHIAVAVGRSFADVPPNRGVYRGEAKEKIRVAVNISEVDEVPKGLLSPRAMNLDVPTFPSGPSDHREQLDYQQEQQQQQ